MFTGLVNQMGEIVAINKQASHWKIMIKPKMPYVDIQLGESISVSGICLSVESCSDKGVLIFSAIHETIMQTSIQNWQQGTEINLERALLASDRLGGHIVQGHVDAMGEITAMHRNTQWHTLHIQFPEKMKLWIVPKGFITLDGMSLTIQSISGNTFAIALVPITEELTIADKYKVGDQVNLEADIITKTAVNYLEVSQCNKKEGNV